MMALSRESRDWDDFEKMAVDLLKRSAVPSPVSGEPKADTDRRRWLESTRCGGCGHTWNGPAVGVLCGDCWRKAIPAVSGEPASPALRALVAEVIRLTEAGCIIDEALLSELRAALCIKDVKARAESAEARLRRAQEQIEKLPTFTQEVFSSWPNGEKRTIVTVEKSAVSALLQEPHDTQR